MTANFAGPLYKRVFKVKRKRVNYQERQTDTNGAEVLVPFDDKQSPERRMEVTLRLSDLVMRIATYVICRAIVDGETLLQDERLSTAHAILQRVTTTHMCNHKLTAEGIVCEVDGQQFQLHEAYKTMTLTRTVYEHLTMFYFLYEHPQTDDERRQMWDDWQHGVQKIPYSQAWRYLFRNREMAQMYHHLSVHCHPVCEGLTQFQSQSDTSQGDECVPLHLSSCFLASLCSMFVRQLPQGCLSVEQQFTRHELSQFDTLSQLRFFKTK